jgi:hypothetical protein
MFGVNCIKIFKAAQVCEHIFTKTANKIFFLKKRFLTNICFSSKEEECKGKKL